jgi:hypothetical protein
VPKKYLCAFRVGHRKNVRDFVDHDDFSHELLDRAEKGDKEAERALEWLAKYNAEFYKGFLKKGDKNALHNTKKLYKNVTDAHNARRRDFLNGPHFMEAQTDGDPIEAYLNEHPNFHHEETIIDLISPKAQRKVDALKKRKP